jgi:hypothetical protein
MRKSSGPKKPELASVGVKLDSALAELHSFRPTPEMRKVKSIVLSRLADDPSSAPGTLLTQSTAERMAGRSLAEWWGQPGFQEWLSNHEEFRERLEGLALTAMDALENVLTQPDMQPTAIVNAAKVVMELASKFPRQQEAPKDPMDNWSKEDLITYLRLYAPDLLAAGATSTEGRKS